MTGRLFLEMIVPDAGIERLAVATTELWDKKVRPSCPKTPSPLRGEGRGGGEHLGVGLKLPWFDSGDPSG